MDETPFSPNIQVSSLKDYLLMTGNTRNIVTEVNGKIAIRLQIVLLDVYH